jgi:hypothetical protein
MPIELTHFGEALAQTLIERRPRKFFELCGLNHTEIAGGRVYREATLKSYNGRRFDGASRVDLIVPLSDQEAIPIEVKLGVTRLSKRRVDTEWLAGCRTTHGDTAWAGNMLSILDQLVPTNMQQERLIAQVDGNTFRLTHTWFVLVRRQIANTWENDPPSFSRAGIIAFDELVTSFRPQEFDAIVKELLSFPYYDTWFKTVPKNPNLLA